MLRVGIVGCGGIAAAHMQGYSQLQDKAKITAVCDVDAAKAASAAERFGPARTYTDVQDLMADSEVDAVSICLPHHLHAPAILAAATAGKHVLCEKPLCTTREEAIAVREAVRASGITLMCAHNQLFEPAIDHAREVISSGALGDIYMASTADCFTVHNSAEQWGWRRNLATAGGGELLDTGYHPTYTLLYLMSLAGLAPIEVAAMQGRYRQMMLEGEDTAHVLVRFNGGAIGQILTSWSFELPEGTHSFHVIGEKGQLYGRRNVSTFQPNGGESQTVTREPVVSYHRQLPHFIDAVEARRRPIQNEDDGVAVLEVILSAYDSDAQKRIVPFAV
ncbi:MAG: putative dehydrogenase [Chloroflexi bacterium]|nr:putative dehydrogenase [Chloroflexota bacterium]